MLLVVLMNRVTSHSLFLCWYGVWFLEVGEVTDDDPEPALCSVTCGEASIVPEDPCHGDTPHVGCEVPVYGGVYGCPSVFSTECPGHIIGEGVGSPDGDAFPGGDEERVNGVPAPLFPEQ